MSTKTWLDGSTLVVQSFQDVEDIIEDNKAWQNAGKQTGDFRKVASIPNNICLQWLNEEYARGNPMRLFSPEWNELVRRKLQDPDWKWLRTT